MIEAKELFSLLSSSTLFDKVIFLEVFASNTKYLRQKLKTFFDTVIISQCTKSPLEICFFIT